MKDIILVTGGNGLVGHGIQRALELDGCPEDEEWHFVGSKDGDLCNLNDTIALFDKYKPTKVIHLAARVGGLYYNIAEQLDFLRLNLLMIINLLQVCTERKVTKVVSFLSTCIFPDNIQLPFDESSIYNGAPHPCTMGYSHAKRLIDVFNKAYYSRLGCQYTSVVPCNIFGPYDNFHPENSHVVPGLIGKLYRTIKTEGNNSDAVFKVLGTGTALRQFIYSLDLGRLTIWALRSYHEIDPIILCDDKENEIPIRKMAEMIARSFNFKGKMKFDASAADGQRAKTASNAKLRKYLPNFKFTPLEVAVKQTVEWYKENADKARN